MENLEGLIPKVFKVLFNPQNKIIYYSFTLRINYWSLVHMWSNVIVYCP